MTVSAPAQERCLHAMIRAFCSSCQPKPTLEKGEHVHKEPLTTTGDALRALYISEDLETGCWLWTGKYRRRGGTAFGIGPERPYIPRVHEMCGHEHFEVSRLLFEEAVGIVLNEQTDVVLSVCATNAGDRRPCVNPDHHEIEMRLVH